MLYMAMAIEAAAMPSMVGQPTADAPTCSAVTSAPEPTIDTPDCGDTGSTATTLADTHRPVTPDDLPEHERPRHRHFTLFGIFGHHGDHHHGHRGHHRGTADPMAGKHVPVTRISPGWHAQYNDEIRASGSDQVPLPEVGVRVMSVGADGAQRNIAHVVLPLRNGSTMLSGVWHQYRAAPGDYRLVLDGTTLEIVADGPAPIARYTTSRVTGYRRVAGKVIPITSVHVMETAIVADGGSHRSYRFGADRLAIETESQSGE